MQAQDCNKAADLNPHANLSSYAVAALPIDMLDGMLKRLLKFVYVYGMTMLVITSAFHDMRYAQTCQLRHSAISNFTGFPLGSRNVHTPLPCF
jgi:hypothetical protein